MRSHILTIDLEDWFHCLEPDPTKWNDFPRRAEDVTRRLLELLSHHDALATFFVLGDVAKAAPQLIRDLVSEGHEVGSHGMTHRFIREQTPQAFANDVRESIDLLEDLSGTPIVSYRAPYFSVTEETIWALDILAELGIQHDSSIFPIRNPRYGMPDANRLPHEILPGLLEWPISTMTTPFGNFPYSGGAYLRILPLWLVRAGFQRASAKNEPAIAYLHPWEIDADQPRHASGSRALDLRHYFRLDQTEARLSAVLGDHSFTSLRTGAEQWI